MLWVIGWTANYKNGDSHKESELADYPLIAVEE